MNRETIPFIPIGVIRSEHVVARQTPIQPVYAKGCKGTGGDLSGNSRKACATWTVFRTST